MIRVIALLSVGFLIGCGPSRQPVTGTVLFDDGGFVTSAIVEFRPESKGKTARGKTDANGVFELTTNGKPGIYPGEYQIIVNQVIVMDGNPEHLRHGGQAVASKYRSFATSGLNERIEIGTQEIELKVASQ